MIEGLSHVTFVVRDLERMTRILTGIFRRPGSLCERRRDILRRARKILPGRRSLDRGDGGRAGCRRGPTTTSPSRSKTPSSKLMRPR